MMTGDLASRLEAIKLDVPVRVRGQDGELRPVSDLRVELSEDTGDAEVILEV